MVLNERDHVVPPMKEQDGGGGAPRLSRRQIFGIVDDLSISYVQEHLKTQEPVLTEIFGDQIQTRVLQLLLQLDQIGFKAIYLLKAAQLLQVSHSSVDRVLDPLFAQGLVLETGVGRRRYFRLNQRNPIIRSLQSFYSTLVKAKRDQNNAKKEESSAPEENLLQ